MIELHNYEELQGEYDLLYDDFSELRERYEKLEEQLKEALYHLERVVDLALDMGYTINEIDVDQNYPRLSYYDKTAEQDEHINDKRFLDAQEFLEERQ